MVIFPEKRVSASPRRYADRLQATFFRTGKGVTP